MDKSGVGCQTVDHAIVLLWNRHAIMVEPCVAIHDHMTVLFIGVLFDNVDTRVPLRTVDDVEVTFDFIGVFIALREYVFKTWPVFRTIRSWLYASPSVDREGLFKELRILQKVASSSQAD